MAKQKKKKLISNRILTIAGLFTAGSVVGASVDFDSLLELDYMIPSVQTTQRSDYEETNSNDDISENEWDTIQIPAVSEWIDSDESGGEEVTEPTVPETEPEQKTPEIPEQPLKEQPIISEIPSPETESAALPEQEIESVFSDDWMEAVFVPSEKTESVPEVTTDWMENTEEFIQENSIPANTSSMTSELAGMLEGIAVFWTKSGEKIHLNPSCRSFENDTVRYAGTLEEAQALRTGGWCKLCAEHWSETDNSEFYIKGNIYSTKEILLNSYTYSDFCNGIPADG